MTQNDWMWVSDKVAANVRSLRQVRGWTAADLADRLAADGYPEITRSVVANIESGRPVAGSRRRHVTVDEVVALAEVLEVKAADLMFGEVTISVKKEEQ